MKVLAIADSDSYLKWSAATLRAMPTGWQTVQLVVDNPVRPSPAQISAAAGGPVDVLSYRAIVDRIRTQRPDAVLLAGTGPMVATLGASRVFRRPDRPVLITGMPGISIPASSRAVTARSGCDLFLVHSRREIEQFAAQARVLAPDLIFGLASLPYLANRHSAHDHLIMGSRRS